MKLKRGYNINIFMKNKGEKLISKIKLSDEHLCNMYEYAEEIDIRDNDIIEINNANETFSEKYRVVEIITTTSCVNIYIEPIYATLSLYINETNENFKNVCYLSNKILNTEIKV